MPPVGLLTGGLISPINFFILKAAPAAAPLILGRGRKAGAVNWKYGNLYHSYNQI